jgi:hypothetical protein
MPERPRPDIDHTREALRRHDERVADEPAEDERGPDERDEDDEEEPGRAP